MVHFSNKVAPDTTHLPSTNIRLSPTEHGNFLNNGFLIRKGVFQAQEIDQALKAADRLIAVGHSSVNAGKVDYQGTQLVLEKSRSGNVIKRIVWAGAAEPDLLALGRKIEILAPVSDILFAESREPGPHTADHLINQLHIKNPGDEVFFPWHQDLRHRMAHDPEWNDVAGNGSFVQTLIALEHADITNGTITMIRGSHHFGDLELSYASESGQLSDSVLPEQVLNLPRDTLQLEPGDMLLFHPLVVHGSEPNRTGKRRITLINGFSVHGANHGIYPGTGSGEQILLP